MTPPKHTEAQLSVARGFAEILSARFGGRWEIEGPRGPLHPTDGKLGIASTDADEVSRDSGAAADEYGIEGKRQELSPFVQAEVGPQSPKVHVRKGG